MKKARPKRRYRDWLRDQKYYDRYKPDGYKHYLTIKELGVSIGREPSWIRKLERQGKLRAPARVTRGLRTIRLYSPELVEEARSYFANAKSGRPKKVKEE